jgi:hypothetical protein
VPLAAAASLGLDRVSLTRCDNVEKNLPPRSFLFIDPPYFHKGSSIYTSFYQRADHETLADRILDLDMPWVLTYDFCDEIHELYTERRQFQFALNYSLHDKRKGTELLIASKGLRVPDELRASQVRIAGGRGIFNLEPVRRRAGDGGHRNWTG